MEVFFMLGIPKRRATSKINICYMLKYLIVIVNVCKGTNNWYSGMYASILI